MPLSPSRIAHCAFKDAIKRYYYPGNVSVLSQGGHIDGLKYRQMLNNWIIAGKANMMRKQSFKCSRSSMIFLHSPSNAVTKCLLLLSVTSFFT